MNKRQLVRLAVGMLVLLLIVRYWGPLFQYIGRTLGYDTNPRQIAETPETATSQPVATAPAPLPPQALRIIPATQPVVAELGSTAQNDPTYRMGVKVSPKGAGLDGVVLNEFKRTARGHDPYVFQEPYSGAKETSRPLATRRVWIGGNSIDLTTAEWSLESVDPRGATYAVTINDETGPLAKLRKSYEVFDKSQPGEGYEISVTQTFENLTDRDLKFKTELNGPTVPPREQDRGGERYTLAGFVANGAIEVAHEMVESYSEKNPTREYAKDKHGNPVMWAGGMSAYFQAIARPVSVKDANSAPDYIQDVSAKLIAATPKAEDHEISVTIATTELTVAARQSQSLPMRVFLGPRQRSLLNSDYFASFPLDFDRTLVMTSGPCGVCTFQWLINWLVWLLKGFHFLFRDWGLAIIGLVVLVRAILHPVTKRSQISMSKMGKMAPEMERLRKKHGDNKEELSKAMWELQKQQGVGPYLGCLPMFLQMPIWIALWQALYTTFELRQAPFLWGMTWIHDLSKPDRLLTWDPIPLLFGWEIAGLNILPLLMGGVFYLQMKFQPQPATISKEQQQQQKIMMWMMPLLFPLMLYNGPSGLNIYILTSTAIGIVESKIVRDHLKQREEAEKAGRIIVDAKPTRASKQGRKLEGAPAPSGGCLFGWLRNLQSYAEQVQREAERKRK